MCNGMVIQIEQNSAMLAISLKPYKIKIIVFLNLVYLMKARSQKRRDTVKVSVRAFGLYREALNSSQFEIELKESETVADLIERLKPESPQLFDFSSLTIFVNGESVSRSHELHDGDQVFFAPLVGGG